MEERAVSGDCHTVGLLRREEQRPCNAIVAVLVTRKTNAMSWEIHRIWMRCVKVEVGRFGWSPQQGL